MQISTKLCCWLHCVTLSNFVIPPEMEEDLAQHIKMLGDMFFGLSLEKCKEAANEFASKNKLKVPSLWEEHKKAGKSWWLGFKSRHRLSVRSPAATSVGRVAAFNRFNVNQYFDNLAKVLDEHKFTAEQIFSVDETGLTTVQTPKKVITAKGATRVGSVTSGEREELVTTVYTICASGNVLPSLLIFPRVHYRSHFVRSGSQDCIGQCSRSGWINEELFLYYLDHLINRTRCSPDHKILLILDNHESHISLRVIDKAKASGIVMLTIFPPKHLTDYKLLMYRCLDHLKRATLVRWTTG